jgi:hypothetical protein
MLYRVTHNQGTGPVYGAIAENIASYTYWNPVLKRQEISTLGMFEGIIDKTGLTPFASHASAAAASVYIAPDAGLHTSFTAQTPLGNTTSTGIIMKK